MKIYISGKITGEPNFAEKFRAAEIELKNQGHAVMTPPVLPPSGFEYGDYMRICLSMIDTCDAVYMLDNWAKSIGARLEWDYAKATGKKILYQEEVDRVETRNFKNPSRSSREISASEAEF